MTFSWENQNSSRNCYQTHMGTIQLKSDASQRIISFNYSNANKCSNPKKMTQFHDKSYGCHRAIGFRL
ncbi:CLUMA_CG019749, isoform A [Clunio marinus]|uniref:CLUMA_CG019749, isoform A n=1 Tax=Clunio marinus TaxID=568069 RepID=A0A1J1J1Q0_9DIPT|nr:CLUMA_CG019749, isoform A [Clunio marinus]